MRLHIYVQVNASDVRPGQRIALPDADGSEVLLTVSTVSCTLHGWEIRAHREGVSKARVLRVSGHHQIMVEPKGEQAEAIRAQVLTAAREVLGRSACCPLLFIDGQVIAPAVGYTVTVTPSEPASNGAEAEAVAADA